jgi:hypothetical protein
MKRSFVVLALLVSAAACGSDPKVVVRASLEEGGTPIQDLPVQLLPYDRQVLLDSLAKAADDPEPTLPQEVLQQQQALVADSAAVFQRGDSTLIRWRAARAQVLGQLAAFRKAHSAWADSAYKDFPEVAKNAAAARQRSEASDTTDTSGRAEMEAELGQYWVYARYILPNSQLEWNLPVTLAGDSLVVALTRGNAKEKPLD